MLLVTHSIYQIQYDIYILSLAIECYYIVQALYKSVLFNAW